MTVELSGETGVTIVPLNTGLYNDVQQHGRSGGLRATSSLLPLVTRPMNLFVNVLLVTTSSFILYTMKD
jgi:hypothetical protein